MKRTRMVIVLMAAAVLAIGTAFYFYLGETKTTVDSFDAEIQSEESSGKDQTVDLENAWHEYRFPYPETFTTWQINSQELSWRDNLIKKLKYTGTPIIYALTDINFYRDGKLVERSVYQNTSRKNQFYVRLEEYFLIIDLEKQQVGVLKLIPAIPKFVPDQKAQERAGERPLLRERARFG